MTSSSIKLTLTLPTHLMWFHVLLSMHFGYVFLEIILFSAWFFKNLHLNGWMLMSTLRHYILKVGGGIINIIYEVNTCTSPTLELTITLFASENAFWLCVSSNDLVQYLIFHKPCIWMLESSCELFCMVPWKLDNGSSVCIEQDNLKKHNLSSF